VQARQRIFKAAIGCFQQYGLRRTTMDDVAAAAGVSRKTVYNYFTNKTGLVAEVIFDEARRVNARARRTLDLDLPGPALIVEPSSPCWPRPPVALHRHPAQPGRLRGPPPR